jgi:FAD binding domain
MSSTTTTKTATSSKESLLSQLSSLISSSDVISPSSPEYLANSQTWSHAHNQNPKLVVRPATLDSLSKVIAFLGKTDLDFKVRSHGYGNASAKDVLVSLTAFDEFEWDEEKKTVTLGAGANWALYYEKMHKVAPDYAIVSARTPSIGVGGSTLCSGFSWLSHERGCVSDPANMLDAQVVLIDGRVIWASEEPDLLWALRGTETGFGVVTKFKFQAFPYPQNGSIYAGPIFIPRDKVPEAAKGIMSMVDQDINGGGADPKISMFLYVMRKELLHLIGVDPGQDVLVIHLFDANGEAHGRETFKWALDIEGAIDQTRGNMTLKDVADMQGKLPLPTDDNPSLPPHHPFHALRPIILTQALN